MASEEKSEAKDEAPKKKVPVLLIGLSFQVLIVLAALGMIIKGVLFTKGPELTEAKMRERAIASVKDNSEKRQTMDLKEFTINISHTHVLKASIQLEISDPETVAVIERRLPAIKYKIINLLSAADAQRAGSFQEKLALKDSLREAINDEIINGGHNTGVVREVYFTTFFLM